MNKATINLSIKSIDDDARLIEGWATRAEQDRVGDIVLPKGAVYKLPLPFLVDHDHRKAVGDVDRVEVTDKGIRFWAHIKKIAEPGEVKDMCDAAWSLVKNGLRKSVSIGFRVLDSERIPNSNGIKIKTWEWLELSAVTVPALASASITSFKSVSPDDLFVTVRPESSAPVRLITAKSIDREHLPSAGNGVSAGDTPGADALAKPRAAFRGSVKLIPRKRK